ncbi:MAG TPA: Rieske 2Fe-2S domain-containing protein [Bradyrhizobium sp.]|nr:Rieske 2Fe-2S domain-containing protein [Bradyrhizobium sp.]
MAPARIEDGQRFAIGPYRGYEQRDVPDPDWDLVRTGPGTKMGEYFRRFWQPVCFSSQLTELPRLVRILGEDLVAFRDKRGRVGVVAKHCCHRGTSLEYGRVEECGIRCCYHGWLFDVDGSVLDTPGEPANSRLKKAVFQGAYPALEYNGLVHVYMGPLELKPEFPEFDVFHVPGLKFYPSSVLHSNNWLQSYENNMDPFHGQFLHTRISPHFGDHYFVLPLVEWKVTEDGKGIFYSAARRVDDDRLWIRLFHCMFPNYVFVASLYDLQPENPFFQRTFWARRVVPVDDEHCIFFSWRLAADEGEFSGGDVSRNGWNSIDFDGQVEQADYETKQRFPGDWEAQTGQRPIAVHKLENLGTTDAGIVKLRQALRKILTGQVPAALPPNGPGALGTRRPHNVYSSNNTLRIKRLADAEAEAMQSRAVSRAVVEAVVEADTLSYDDRVAFIKRRLGEIEQRHA